jgi:hypothetical protein
MNFLKNLSAPTMLLSLGLATLGFASGCHTWTDVSEDEIVEDSEDESEGEGGSESDDESESESGSANEAQGGSDSASEGGEENEGNSGGSDAGNGDPGSDDEMHSCLEENRVWDIVTKCGACTPGYVETRGFCVLLDAQICLSEYDGIWNALNGTCMWHCPEGVTTDLVSGLLCIVDLPV